MKKKKSWTMRCSVGGEGPSVIIVLYIVIISSQKNLYLCKVYGESRQLFGLKCTNILSEFLADFCLTIKADLFLMFVHVGGTDLDQFYGTFLHSYSSAQYKT